MVVLMFHADLVLDKLKFSWVESTIADDVSKNRDGFTSVALEGLKTIAGVFSIAMSLISGTHLFNLRSKFALRFVRGSSQGHLLEKVRGSCCLKALMSGSSSYIDTNTIDTQRLHDQKISYCAVCPGILSEQTLIPFESVVESIIIK